MDELFGYHVVLTTHNSRKSHRMETFRIKKGLPRLLNLKEEIILTEIIGDIISANQFRCVAYNICCDHVHMILVCAEGQLVRIIQKLKSISSKLFHKNIHITEQSIALHKNHLWSQKFFRANLDEWELSQFSNEQGVVYNSSYLFNAINYIKRNRKKHNLPESKELQNLIGKFVITLERAYSIV